MEEGNNVDQELRNEETGLVNIMRMTGPARTVGARLCPLPGLSV